MRTFAMLCALAVGLSQPAVAQVSDPAAAADAILGPMTPDRPGAVVLFSRGGETRYSRAFGAADLEQGTRIGPDTRFHVASLSKQFTAFAVALLAHEGRIDLAADIRSYLPELPDFGARITVANLLHHTSGLRDQWDLFAASGTNMQSLLTQQAILALVRSQRELNFAPGTEYRYSNTGYALAAEIVARVSGMPFRRFVEDRIFAPLGMTNSLIYDDASEPVPGRAQSYAPTPAGGMALRRLNYSNYGATSMFSTAADLDKWSRELLHPRVFDAALLRSLAMPTRLADGTPSNYGLGMYRTTVRGHDVIMHTGSDAGFRALAVSYPQDDATFIILANGSTDVVMLHEQLVDIFLGRRAQESAVVQPTPGQLERLAGYYASGWGSGLELKVEDGRLIRGGGGGPGPAVLRADGTIEFTAPLTRFMPLSGSDGRIVALEERPLSGPPLRHERMERAAVPASEFRELAGRYRSEELDITYRLALASDRLTLSSLQSPEPVPLVPVRRDWFDLPGVRIMVVRGADGRASGLRITSGRMRNLRFDRVD